MKFVKLAAIDIGSNSIRLLISNVIPTPEYTHYQKVSMTRLPVRLGADVFTNGEISSQTSKRLIDAFRAYRYIMKVNGVEGLRACATSAMREAKNGDKISKLIKDKTGIELELIDGAEEARLVFESKMFDKIQPTEKNFLYIDVGGGSTELTLWQDGEITDSKSFKIGTIRLLNSLVSESDWKGIKEWVEEVTKDVPDIALIGSGGNINKVHKISGKLPREPLTLTYLNQQYKLLNSLTAEQRVIDMGLNFDRADVIVHALRIYNSVLKWAGAKKIYVPKIGVSDGIIRDFYHSNYKEQLESKA